MTSGPLGNGSADIYPRTPGTPDPSNGLAVQPAMKTLFAQQLGSQWPKGKDMNINLADAITDIQIESTIVSAPTLVLTVDDPTLYLLTSGFIDVDADGFLLPIAVNYPVGSEYVWVLSMFEPTSDLSQANLTLTFEGFAVWALRQQWGYMQATRTTANPTQDTISLYKYGLAAQADKKKGGGTAKGSSPHAFLDTIVGGFTGGGLLGDTISASGKDWSALGGLLGDVAGQANKQAADAKNKKANSSGGGGVTRAQFIKSLVDEVQGLQFICPELNVVQPVSNAQGTGIVGDSTGAQNPAADKSKKGSHADKKGGVLDDIIKRLLPGFRAQTVGGALNQTITPFAHEFVGDLDPDGNPLSRSEAKAPGIHPAQTITLVGSPEHTLLPYEIRNAELMLDVARSVGASALATLAMVEAAVVRGPYFQSRPDGHGGGGVLQFPPARCRQLGFNPMDVATSAYVFLTQGMWDRGAMDTADGQPLADASVIASQVISPTEPLGAYDQHEFAAQKVIIAYGAPLFMTSPVV